MDVTQKITSDDALALAYAVGELDGAELSQFEARLATDPALSARTSELRRDYEQTMQAVASLDATYRVDDRRSLQQINLSMQQWETQQAQISAPLPLRHWRPPAWAYAAAAMVLLFVGFCFWWANNQPADEALQIPTTQPTQAVLVATSQTAQSDDEPVPMPLAFEDVSSENSDQISALEKDVVALSNDQMAGNNMTSGNNQ